MSMLLLTELQELRELPIRQLTARRRCANDREPVKFRGKLGNSAENWAIPREAAHSRRAKAGSSRTLPSNDRRSVTRKRSISNTRWTPYRTRQTTRSYDRGVHSQTPCDPLQLHPYLNCLEPNSI
ncbi:MAG: hypothetical protein IJD43_10965 [Thermoguttaceae bacterium]|nr:hypothetical protein [Thermoguttaceae bacterium]